MSLFGQWMIEGKDVPQDPAAGLDLITRAADKYERTALFLLGRYYAMGQQVPKDEEKGLTLMRQASMQGSEAAQLYLGTRYETGDSILPKDLARSRQYLRLCATRGVAECQFRLGRLLVSEHDEARADIKTDLVQGFAWLELAATGPSHRADALAQSVRERLSPGDLVRVEKLKAQLVRR